MPLICATTPYTLDEGVTIISTDYEVANDPLMEDVFLYSYNDTKNLRSIVFDFDPEEGRTYYGRVRSKLSTGPLEYGPITEYRFDQDNNEFLLTTPSPINTPRLETLFWRTEHPPSCFTITASGYEVIGNSKLARAVWTITDIEKNEVVSFMDTKVNLFELFVDIMLDYKTSYNIDVMFFGDNDSVSARGSIIITTSGKIMNYRNLKLVSTEEDTVVIKDSNTIANSKHEWYLLNEDSEQINSEESEESSISSFIIDHTKLKKGQMYLLQSREMNSKKPDAQYEYLIFRTFPETIYGLPSAVPYKLGAGTSINTDSGVDNSYE